MAGLPESWLAEEAAIVQKSEQEQQVYLYEWLQRLEEILKKTDLPRTELKACKGKITIVLQRLMKTNISSAARNQLARCLATLFKVGDTSGLFETVSWCADIVKNKEDSAHYPQLRLSAISCLGEIFESIGRLVQTLFPDVEQVLYKMLKTADPHLKCEILGCFQKMLAGLDSAASLAFKDFFKASKMCLVEKAPAIRCAAAKCALELSRHAEFLYTNELEGMVSSILKALEGSSYDVRMCCAELLGTLMAMSQNEDIDSRKFKKISLDDMFGMMSSGFLRGAVGFLKAGASSGDYQDVRVGVTQAYVVLFRELGTKWIEKNLSRTINYILDLVSNPRATTTHVESVYSRKCVSFVLNSVLTEMVPEPVQMNAVKELAKIISKQMNIVHELVTTYTSSNVVNNPDVVSTQHVLVCALNQLGSLIRELGSSIEPIFQGIITSVLSALIHPAPSTWLSAAWCMRCCTAALPSAGTGLLNECLSKMNSLRSSAEATIGYGHTLAALIGGLDNCPLGIPFKLAKSLFALAEELLMVQGSNFKLTTSKVRTGWTILGALMTLGPSFAKHCLARVLQLWSSAFPATVKDVQSEANKGTPTSWELTLHMRSGALCCICSFIKYCPSLVTKDITSKLLTPFETGLATIPLLPNLIKTHGTHLKPHCAMLKLRLYSALALLPARTLEGSFSPLLRELVAEFTLADHRGATTTSLLQSMCHKDDSVLLGSWVQETDHKTVEEQLQGNSASGSGALEHDNSCVYARCQQGEDLPGPLPLGVAVIDTSIMVFGQIFPYTVQKHRGQLMEHFIECITKNKGPRQQAIQMNIFTAFLAALKNLAEKKIPLGEKGARDAATNLVLEALGNPDPILRCAAGEALGRMAQVVQDPNFVAQMAQLSFEKAKTARDIASRTGHSLALGCLHRYVGGMGSGQHVNSSIAILMALAKDESSSTVQMWALHALTLIADSGGPMFRSHVEPSIYLTLNLLLRTPPSFTEIHQCLGKCIGALITTVGPELQDSTKIMKTLQMFCITACSVMQNHPDSLVQAESTTCLQQLHMFAPNFVNLALLIPQLCSGLLSSQLLLRRASVACMRQLSHREAKEVCDHSSMTIQGWTAIKHRMFVGELGLEGILFTLFDREVDLRLKADIRETLVSLLQTLASENLSHWLSLCKQVLLASKVEAKADDAGPSPDEASKGDRNDEDENEEEEIVVAKPRETQSVTPKWPTRVFAMECIRMIVHVCAQEKAHRDLAVARERRKTDDKSDFLALHLSELVRMAFIAGTSNNDQLRLEGMKALQDVVNIFARVEDPDIPGHVILEQFQAQVGTALRPAFTPSTPPDITAMACEVCSAWIGSEISRDISDVRRIQQLLSTSLGKLSSSTADEQKLYSESAYTLETLAVLKAWAQIYIMAMKHEQHPAVPVPEEEALESHGTGSLLDLVENDLRLLLKHWVDALRDYAYLMLPPQYALQLPAEGGNFYRSETTDDVRAHYKHAWPPLLHAVTLWLNDVGFHDADQTVLGASDEAPSPSKQDADSMLSCPKAPEDINNDRYHLLSGICMEALCAPLHCYPDETMSTVIHAMTMLHQSDFGRTRLNVDKALSIELLTVLYRLLLTKDDHSSVKDIVSLVTLVSKGAVEHIKKKRDDTASWGPEDDIIQGKSVVFSLMEISLYVISQYALEMIPAASSKAPPLSGRHAEPAVASFEILAGVSSILADVPFICSPTASVETLPSLLYLVTGILHYFVKCAREIKLNGEKKCKAVETAFLTTLQSLERFVSSTFMSQKETQSGWKSIVQSALMSVLDFNLESTSEELAERVLSENIDGVKLLSCLSVFLLKGPVELFNRSSSLDDCMDMFSLCYASDRDTLKIKVVRILREVIKHREPSISYPFIHRCVPAVVKDLERVASSRQQISPSQFELIKESISLLELLIEATEESKRSHMMAVFLRCLLELLQSAPRTGPASRMTKQLHEHSLQRLTEIGPMYPQAFKSVMATSQDLKSKLEAALRASQTSTQGVPKTSSHPAKTVQPKIQLKMDFSNFR